MKAFSVVKLKYTFRQDIKIKWKGRKSGLVVSKLDSRSKDCGFESRLIKILDGNGLKAIPGSIPLPNSGSFMEN